MVILQDPDNVEDYFCTDGDLAFELQQKGFKPKFKGFDGCLYFKKSNKLLKYLSKIGEVEEEL